MTQVHSTHRGLAVLCDIEGVITEVIRDDTGSSSPVREGSSFLSLMGGSNADKGARFLKGLREKRAVFDWELLVSIEGRSLPMHFFGGDVGDRLLIAGSTSRNDADHYFEELMRVHNEQINMLRTTLQQKDRVHSEGSRREDHLYNELSKLNNELVNLHRDLFRRNQELEMLRERQNEFVGMAAHDLRNPLWVIRGCSDLILRSNDQKLSDRQRQLVGRIRESGRFMLQLVNDLLDISAIESGKLQMRRSSVDLLELCRGSIELSELYARQKDVQIDLQSNVDQIEIDLDATKIEQLLSNLLSNAVKFSYPSSTVLLRVQGHLTDEVVLSVEDEGEGIAADQFEELFHSFSTGGRTGTSGEKTTGLGLLISRKIVEAHEGRIWVESAPGEGSRFFVSLPRVKSAVPAEDM